MNLRRRGCGGVTFIKRARNFKKQEAATRTVIEQAERVAG
jgi:hypothetical protein